MASIPIQITGVLTYSGLEVGGGPLPGGPGSIDPGYGARPGWGLRPDQGLPGWQPHPDQGLPGWQPHPDQGLPGWQPRPDQGLPGPQPGPSHPIVLPPGEVPPPGDGLSPTHPIYLPPDQPATGEKALVYVNVVGYGDVWFLIEAPVEGRPPPSGATPKRQ